MVVILPWGGDVDGEGTTGVTKVVPDRSLSRSLDEDLTLLSSVARLVWLQTTTDLKRHSVKR